MKSAISILLSVGLLYACSSTPPDWQLALRHTSDGVVISGSKDSLIHAIRRGCKLRVGWGAKRKTDSSKTVEHLAAPVWITVRDSSDVEIQLDDFLINLPVLGEPAAEHPKLSTYGGTEKAVFWRANLKTDGTFNAVWYDRSSGELITRIPQRHPMSWFTDCTAMSSSPLFGE